MESEILKEVDDETETATDDSVLDATTTSDEMDVSIEDFFSPRWAAVALAAGITMQVGAGFVGAGVLGGLTGLGILGIVMGFVSEKSVVPEAAASGFLITTGSYILSNILVSLLGVGLVAAAGHGLVGLLVAGLGALAAQYAKSRIL